jgi:hypothetical protein
MQYLISNKADAIPQKKANSSPNAGKTPKVKPIGCA